MRYIPFFHSYTDMQTETFSYNDEQFADLQMLRYRVDGFDRLSIARKKLIYYLSEAALTGRDILWDQNGKYTCGYGKRWRPSTPTIPVTGTLRTSRHSPST